VERFLDIGCDDGRITIGITKAIGAKEVFGVDVFEPSVQVAQQKGIKCRRLDLDKDDLPFPDNHFDAIFWGENIEHLFDPDHLLDEIFRCLSSNGICVISTPNLASLPNRIALLFGLQPYMTSVSIRHRVGRIWYQGLPAEDHIRVFTYRALRDLVHLHDFNIIEIQGLTASDGTDSPFPLPIRIAERVIALVPAFSHTIQIVIKKRIKPDEIQIKSGNSKVFVSNISSFW
jgi:SAM-dependent methyltransferase